MKQLSKNIVLITLLVLANLAIFLFCRLLTDEGNYIWYKTDPHKKLLVASACLELLRINYFIYANSINFFFLGIYFAYYYRKTLGTIIALLGLVILFAGNALFNEGIVYNYYIIFKNQNVPHDFVLEPVKSAGKNIGPFLVEDIKNKISPVRKAAISGVGEIRYEPSIDLLNEIMHDLDENPEARGEAYFSLVKMDTEKSASYLRIFRESTHPIADQATMEYIQTSGRVSK